MSRWFEYKETHSSLVELMVITIPWWFACDGITAGWALVITLLGFRLQWFRYQVWSARLEGILQGRKEAFDLLLPARSKAAKDGE